jgi:hypothetical protein
MFFIIINALHVSGGPSAYHQESINVYVRALGIVMLSCCLPLVWMGCPLSTGALYGRSQRVTIPDAVKYNFDLLKMSIVLLETCRGI